MPTSPRTTRVVIKKGAPGIRTENALLSAYIYIDIRGRNIGSYVKDAKQAVSDKVRFPPGYGGSADLDSSTFTANRWSTWRHCARFRI